MARIRLQRSRKLFRDGLFPESPICFRGDPEWNYCLNALGALVWREWIQSFDIRQECRPGAFVVMPNHWHGVIHILDPVDTFPEPDNRDTFSNSSGRSLPALMRGLKSRITSHARQELSWAEGPVCQSRYWEHVIRNEADYTRINAYIRNNPAHWKKDCFYP